MGLPLAKRILIEGLSREISGLRYTLGHTALQNGLTSSKVLALSQRLDALLVEYTYLAEGNLLRGNTDHQPDGGNPPPH